MSFHRGSALGGETSLNVACLKWPSWGTSRKRTRAANSGRVQHADREGTVANGQTRESGGQPLLHRRRLRF